MGVRSGDVVSVAMVENFVYAVDSNDVVYCASNPDSPAEADWEVMKDVAACQLAVSHDGNVAWRLTR